MAGIVRKVTVDRIEGDVAVLLDGGAQVDVPRAWLPPGAGEGSALVIGVELDPDAEAALRQRVEGAHARLTGGDPGDDEIEL